MTSLRWAVSLGLIVLSTGCGKSQVVKPTSPAANSNATSSGVALVGARAARTAAVNDLPMVSVLSSIPGQNLPVPNAMPPAGNTVQPPPASSVSRDPFAAMPVTPAVRPRTASSAAPAPAPTSASTVTPTPAAPVVPSSSVAVAPNPALQPSSPVPSAPASAPANPGPVPTVNVPAQPSPAVSLANAVVISGVVQVADRTSVIIEVPGEATSRYANEGDRIAGGRVLVKRIVVEAGQEPVVILEQDGVEVVRSVGTGIIVGSL